MKGRKPAGFTERRALLEYPAEERVNVDSGAETAGALGCVTHFGALDGKILWNVGVFSSGCLFNSAVRLII